MINDRNGDEKEEEEEELNASRVGVSQGRDKSFHYRKGERWHLGDGGEGGCRVSFNLCAASPLIRLRR